MSNISKMGFCLSMILAVTLTGCSMDEGLAGKGEGVLKYKGKTYQISNADMYVGRPSSSSGIFGETGRHITFFDNKGKELVMLSMSSAELSSTTYNSRNENELFVWYILERLLDTDPSYNIVMDVFKSDEKYDITITGTKNDKDIVFTLTYKGVIREASGGDFGKNDNNN